MSIDNYLKTLLGVEIILQTDDSTVYLEGFTAWIVMNLKNRPVNVLSPQLSQQTIETLNKLDMLISQDRVRAVVFCSGKRDSFIAGADIDILYPITDQQTIYNMSRSGHAVFNRIETLRVPTFAAINGAAMGGGLELCLSCDYRLIADNNKAQIGLPEVKLGLLPGAGGTQRLPRLIGSQQSLPLILAGSQIKPQKALKLKIVDAVYPSQDISPDQHIFYINVRQFVNRHIGKKPKLRVYQPKTLQDKLLENTSLGNYIVASQAGKGLDKQAKGQYPASYYALDSAIHGKKVGFNDNGFDYEGRNFSVLGSSPEHKALTSLYYMFENSKKVSLHVKQGKPIKVTHCGVIGAGVMGWQIAALCANKKINVYMRDIKQEIVDKGKQSIKDTLQKRVDKRRLTVDKVNNIFNHVQGGTSLEPLKQCNLIIEAAVEQMNLKKKIVAELENILPENTIIGTNTSSLSINELAESSKRPHNIVGIHFFNPVNKMPLVEIIKSKYTSDDTVATAYNYALSLGKIPVICNDCPGFIVNRILGIYMNEAGHIAMQGVDIQTIDQALLDFGMPMGPFRLMDEVGLDVAGHVAPILHNGLGERYAQSPEFPKLLEKNKAYLGKKTGKGFYVYDGDKQKGVHTHVVNQLKSIVKPSKYNITKQDIIDRCVLLQVNEAAYVLAENIVANPADLDLAMVCGTGFAPFTGGLLAYADQRGIQNIVARLTTLKERYGSRFTPHPLLIEMASNNKRFHQDRPDPKLLKLIPRPLPYSSIKAKL